MVIGLAAYRYINHDIAFHMAQMDKAMRAAQGKADLLCFGEAFLQGFDAMNWDYAHDCEVAVSQDSALIRTLCDRTVRYGVDLMFGYLEREGEMLYSSCMVIENGRILHNYRRISKGWKEYWHTDGHYREGDTTCDFEYRGKTFRIALCGDLWDYPERFQTKGTLLWPVCCNFTRKEWEEQYQAEYLEQAALAARKTLFVDAYEDGSDAVRAAFCFTEGRIGSSILSDADEILYVEV